MVFGQVPFGGLVNKSLAEIALSDSTINISVVNEQFAPAAAFIGRTEVGFKATFTNVQVSVRGIFSSCGCLSGTCPDIQASLCDPKVYQVTAS